MNHTCKVCGKFRVPDYVYVAKRLAIRKSDNIGNWYLGWSDRNSNEFDEGTWGDWVTLSNVIREIENERNGKELCICLSNYDY